MEDHMSVTRVFRILVSLLILLSPLVTNADSSDIRIDKETIRKAIFELPAEVRGLVFIDVYDYESGERIDSVEEAHEVRAGRVNRRWGCNRWRWEIPDGPMRPFTFHARGYRPLELSGVRVPWDSLLAITVRMIPGDTTQTIAAANAWECCIDTVYADLDEYLPYNTIEGHTKNALTGAPIANVQVYCEETGESGKTDDSGYYSLDLGGHKRVAIHSWHPQFDSIRFQVEKQVIRGRKTVNVNFERRRSHLRGETSHDKEILFLVSEEPWSSWGWEGNQSRDYFTYLVEVGELFGPQNSWLWTNCPPFRLIAIVDSNKTLVQFTEFIRQETNIVPSGSNFAEVTDSATVFQTNSLDGGITLTLQRVGEYTPQNVASSDRIVEMESLEQLVSTMDGKTGECDSLHAELERIHLFNFFLLEGRQFEELATRFSTELVASFDTIPINAENLARALPLQDPEVYSTKRLGELFSFAATKVYVHAECGESPNERFLQIMDKAGLTPQRGDAYVFIPMVPDRSYAFGMVYRKEGGVWKIISW